MDPIFLSRLQFGLTISFHYIFPQLTIGLGFLLVIMEAVYLRTRDKFYLEATRFWVKVFALIFSIGVATGIVMEFQFGTNWSNFSRFVGDVFGSALAAEGIFAFFLESGFLAVLLFGWDRVGPKMHFLATCMVALGSTFSAIWIIVANSWMQTPAGYHIVPVAGGGTRGAEITDFWALVFNPSSMDRLWHSVMGAWQSGSWLVISVAAFYLLKARHIRFARFSMKAALGLALVSSILQLVSGHDSAKVVAQYQPAKLAAFEGHWETKPAGLYLFGWVDAQNRQTHGLSIPGMLSWLTVGDSEKSVQGLNDFGKDLPPVSTVFQTYHAMIAIGFTLIGLSVAGCFFWWRKTLFQKRWLLWIFVCSVALPQLANQLGWFSAEAGRQPWIVYGLMRTSDGTSPKVKPEEILTSVIMFSLVYMLLGALFIFLLNHKIKHGPEEEAHGDKEHGHPVHLLQGDRADL